MDLMGLYRPPFLILFLLLLLLLLLLLFSFSSSSSSSPPRRQRGRLKVCSNSILFDPMDSADPIVKVVSACCDSTVA